VGPKTAERLLALDITTIGDLAQASPDELARLLGKHGEDMARRAQGVDDSPIVTEREAKSFSQEETFARDVGDPARLQALIDEQAVSLARQLQKNELTATTVKLKIRWPDFTTLTRQVTSAPGFDSAERIAEIAWMLLEKIWEPGKRVRLLGVGVSGFTSHGEVKEHPKQLGLWGGELEH
jgi:DNA polymerase-4